MTVYKNKISHYEESEYLLQYRPLGSSTWLNVNQVFQEDSARNWLFRQLQQEGPFEFRVAKIEHMILECE